MDKNSFFKYKYLENNISDNPDDIYIEYDLYNIKDINNYINQINKKYKNSSILIEDDLIILNIKIDEITITISTKIFNDNDDNNKNIDFYNCHNENIQINNVVPIESINSPIELLSSYIFDNQQHDYLFFDNDNIDITNNLYKFSLDYLPTIINIGTNIFINSYK